ncbi:DUF3800 domain-containing protein [Mycobacterium heidelbergense]|uniref:Uncharacterized protein n=1 Tax=Mycobacterium heidelbergense TaxID=53376 RepID=A0A1X0DQZ3_MYCHE|nr:DUF3800 domain-containing protein [Mycobacterium heidelbergense]MCV7051108.1 DUF3800 domain-containing protein [Mycobacterium heidelbergense]ORA74794.1 hypothetical protein BST25_08190 [Mycobacterium heidelbergense]BBZ51585.1 hypothetical protein MHEI_33020 [Mycobacterium heidelbergense]
MGMALMAAAKHLTATFFIDESGAKATSGNFFVVAGIKCRQPGRLQRKIEELRDRTGYREEFKFSRISRERLPVFRELVEVVASSDIRLIGSVIDRSRLDNPFKGDDEWRVHARIAAQLIVGNINMGEHVAAVLDHRSTKPNVSFGDTVKSMANYGMSTPAVVSAITVDSEANDLLQVADLIAGAIGNHRREPRPRTFSKKAQVAWDLAHSLGVRDFISDTHKGRVNIKTVTKMRRGQPT